MNTQVQQAQSYLAYELSLFSTGKDADYFDPRNRDMWVVSFCMWLADKQRRSAARQASND